MEIIFANKEYLLFLLGIPVITALHYYSLHYMRQKALKFSNFEAIEKVTKGKPLPTNYLLLFMRILIVATVVLAAAGTTLWYTGKATKSEFVLTIDASTSMLAKDFEPDRLQAAKEAAATFTDTIFEGSANIGVASFAGTVFVKQKLTKEQNKVMQAISDLDVETGGTAIGDAIITSTNMFKEISSEEETQKAKRIILLTDGRNNVGASTEEAIAYAKENDVTIDVVGVGTIEGAPFTAGIIAVSSIDEDALRFIAHESGGKYYLAKNKQELIDAFKELATLTDMKLRVNLSPYLLLLGLALLFIEFTLANTRYRIMP